MKYFNDITREILKPIDVSLEDPGTQLFTRYEETRIYSWEWRTNILANGDIVVTLIEYCKKGKNSSLAKDFVFKFKDICAALERFNVNVYSLPTILGRKSRYYESIMTKIDMTIREEASFAYKGEIPEGILEEVQEKNSPAHVELSERYRKSVESVAKWQAVYRAINNHGNYESAYGGRLFNFGRVIRPTYFGAIPPV